MLFLGLKFVNAFYKIIIYLSLQNEILDVRNYSDDLAWNNCGKR